MHFLPMLWSECCGFYARPVTVALKIVTDSVIYSVFEWADGQTDMGSKQNRPRLLEPNGCCMKSGFYKIASAEDVIPV